jgi:hypothetical protein
MATDALVALGVRNGAALVCVTGDDLEYPLATQRSLTRRGARRAFAKLIDRMATAEREPLVTSLTASGEPVTVVITRIERRRVVARQRRSVPPGANGPNAGVREPRRPIPPSGSADVALDLP